MIVSPDARTRPLVSVVTPLYNMAGFLPRTARSILDQTGDFDLEWIVTDGQSTDGGVDLLSQLARTDPRVKWTSEPDHGQSNAINKGFSRASGTILAWLGADDLYEPGAIAKVVEMFSARPDVHWLVGRCAIINPDDQIIRPSIARYKQFKMRRYKYRRLLRENFIDQPSTFWRRSLFETVGPIDESLHYTMDYDLWLRFARHADPLYVDHPLARFRLHPGSKTGAVNRGQFDEQFAVASRHFGRDKVSRLIHRFNVEKIVWSYRAMKLVGM